MEPAESVVDQGSIGSGLAPAITCALRHSGPWGCPIKLIFPDQEIKRQKPNDRIQTAWAAPRAPGRNERSAHGGPRQLTVTEICSTPLSKTSPIPPAFGQVRPSESGPKAVLMGADHVLDCRHRI